MANSMETHPQGDLCPVCGVSTRDEGQDTCGRTKCIIQYDAPPVPEDEDF